MHFPVMSTWYWHNQLSAEPQGPITPGELKNLATSNKLNRDDFVWKAGMKDWVRAHQLKGLFEPPPMIKQPPQIKSSPASIVQTPDNRSDNPVEPDSGAVSEAIESDAMYEGNPTFLSYRGRLRRTHYFLQSLAIAFPVVLVDAASGDSIEAAGIAAILWFIATVLASFPFVKRLHDLNLSGAFFWISFIPLINIFFGLYALFARGTKGQNKYGPDPRD